MNWIVAVMTFSITLVVALVLFLVWVVASLPVTLS